MKTGGLYLWGIEIRNFFYQAGAACGDVCVWQWLEWRFPGTGLCCAWGQGGFLGSCFYNWEQNHSWFHWVEQVIGLTQPWDVLSFAALPSSACREQSWPSWSCSSSSCVLAVCITLRRKHNSAQTLACIVPNLLQLHPDIKQEGRGSFGLNDFPAENIWNKKEAPT